MENRQKKYYTCSRCGITTKIKVNLKSYHKNHKTDCRNKRLIKDLKIKMVEKDKKIAELEKEKEELENKLSLINKITKNNNKRLRREFLSNEDVKRLIGHYKSEERFGCDGLLEGLRSNEIKKININEHLMIRCGEIIIKKSEIPSLVNKIDIKENASCVKLNYRYISVVMALNLFFLKSFNVNEFLEFYNIVISSNNNCYLIKRMIELIGVVFYKNCDGKGWFVGYSLNFNSNKHSLLIDTILSNKNVLSDQAKLVVKILLMDLGIARENKDMMEDFTRMISRIGSLEESNYQKQRKFMEETRKYHGGGRKCWETIPGNIDLLKFYVSNLTIQLYQDPSLNSIHFYVAVDALSSIHRRASEKFGERNISYSCLLSSFNRGRIFQYITPSVATKFQSKRLVHLQMSIAMSEIVREMCIDLFELKFALYIARDGLAKYYYNVENFKKGNKRYCNGKQIIKTCDSTDVPGSLNVTALMILMRMDPDYVSELSVESLFQSESLQEHIIKSNEVPQNDYLIERTPITYELDSGVVAPVVSGTLDSMDFSDFFYLNNTIDGNCIFEDNFEEAVKILISDGGFTDPCFETMFGNVSNNNNENNDSFSMVEYLRSNNYHIDSNSMVDDDDENSNGGNSDVEDSNSGNSGSNNYNIDSNSMVDDDENSNGGNSDVEDSNSGNSDVEDSNNSNSGSNNYNIDSNSMVDDDENSNGGNSDSSMVGDLDEDQDILTDSNVLDDRNQQRNKKSGQGCFIINQNIPNNPETRGGVLNQRITQYLFDNVKLNKPDSELLDESQKLIYKFVFIFTDNCDDENFRNVSTLISLYQMFTKNSLFFLGRGSNPGQQSKLNPAELLNSLFKRNISSVLNVKKEQAQKDIEGHMKKMEDDLKRQTWAKVPLAGAIFDYSTIDGYYTQEETDAFKSLLKTVLKKENFHECFDWRHKFTQQEIDKIYDIANDDDFVFRFLEALNFLNHHALIDTHHLLVFARCNSFKGRIPCKWCSDHSSDITEENKILLTLFDGDCSHNIDEIYRGFFNSPGFPPIDVDAEIRPFSSKDSKTKNSCLLYLQENGITDKLSGCNVDEVRASCQFFSKNGYLPPNKDKHTYGETIDENLNPHDFDILKVREFLQQSSCANCKSNIATIMSRHIDHIIDHKYKYKKNCKTCNQDIIDKQSTKDSDNYYHHYSCFKYQQNKYLHQQIKNSTNYEEVGSFCQLNKKK